MAKRFGKLPSIGKAEQPGGRITIKSDGSAEGVLIYECDAGSILSVIPPIWSRHPREPSLFAHQIDIDYLTCGLARATINYFGLTSSYDGNAGRDKDSIEIISEGTLAPINTHPDFERFAGSPGDPRNGALWVDATTGEVAKTADNAEFKGWTSGEFAGTESYFVPGAIIRRNYYSRSAINGPKPGTIVRSIRGFKGSAGRNYLVMGWTAREIGGIWQITEEYKAGDWNEQIYKG